MASATFLSAFASDDATVANSARSLSGLTCDAAAELAGQTVPLATRGAHTAPLVHLLAIAASTTDSRLYPNFLTAAQQLAVIASGEVFEHNNRMKCEFVDCPTASTTLAATSSPHYAAQPVCRLPSPQLLTSLEAFPALLSRSDSLLLELRFFARSSMRLLAAPPFERC